MNVEHRTSNIEHRMKGKKKGQNKLRISLKKLRETQRWLNLVMKVPLIENTELLSHIQEETEQLIKIFVTSIKTAEKKRRN